MRRVARMYVRTDAVADEVVQDAWVGVLQGLHRFEGRSSLRTWIFRILVNIAKKRGQREGRSVPFAALAGDDLDTPSFDPAMFHCRSATAALDDAALRLAWDPRGPGGRARDARGDRPGDRRAPADAGRGPPPARRPGWTSEEVRNALDLTETNQRVLLHRARAKVRRALEAYLGSETT